MLFRSWGKVTHDENKRLADLNAREIATLVPLVVLCFWIGVYPRPFLAFLHKPMAVLAETVQPGRFGAAAQAATAAPAGPVPVTPVVEEPIVPEGAANR